MKYILGWWYAISLPKRLPAVSPSPVERERLRYAHLTAGFLLLLICTFLPLSPIMLFFSPASPSSPPIAIGMFCILALSWLLGRLGRQVLSACCIIAYIFLAVTGPLLTNPLDASLIPLFSTFTIAIVLAGALLPPVAALITGALSCLDIALVAMLSLRAEEYNRGAQLHLTAMNVLSLAVMLPVAIQIIIAVLVYVIMRNLLTDIQRADRAEEIIALQEAIAEHEQGRLREKEQLEEGFRRIAEAHARIANGDYQARVALREGHVLWPVAGSLNNLLNRLQAWKADSDALLLTHRAATFVAERLRWMLQTGQTQPLSLTGTSLDPVIIEINRVMASGPASSSEHLSQR